MKQRFFKNTSTSYLAFIASIVLIFGATMHSEIATGKEVNVEKYMKLLDRKTDKKRESIRNTKTSQRPATWRELRTRSWRQHLSHSTLNYHCYCPLGWCYYGIHRTYRIHRYGCASLGAWIAQNL